MVESQNQQHFLQIHQTQLGHHEQKIIHGSI